MFSSCVLFWFDQFQTTHHNWHSEGGCVVDVKACQKCQIPQSDVKLYKYRICNFYHHFSNCGKSAQSLVPHHHYLTKQDSDTHTPGKQYKLKVSFKIAQTNVLLNPLDWSNH